MQSKSNLLSAIDCQADLPLARAPKNDTVSLDIIGAQRTFSAALQLAVNASGLDDKEIYLPLGIDASHWTRIRKGEAHFPVDKLNDLCDLIGNEIPLIWWAHSRGQGLHMLESEAERRLRLEQERCAKAEEENRLLRDLLVGRGK